MLYLCGSDLESRYGYASDALRDIQRCKSYEFMQCNYSVQCDRF